MYNKLLEIAKSITDSYRERYWAAADAVNKGTPPPPAAPNYAEANREGIKLLKLRLRWAGSGLLL